MKPDKVVVIGASTGGPRVLVDLFSGLTSAVNIPIVVAVHTPIDIGHIICDGIEKRIKNESNSERQSMKCKTAVHKENIADRVIYFSPGRKHTQITKDIISDYLHLDDEPSGTLFRPSVDILFSSAANVFKSNVMGIIMTGLSTGNDGVEGCKRIKNNGGIVVAQDQKTSICFGMPKNIIDKGLADYVLPTNIIAKKIEMFSKGLIKAGGNITAGNSGSITTRMYSMGSR
jgi:two-component system chemotaxis response regulator CheB